MADRVGARARVWARAMGEGGSVVCVCVSPGVTLSKWVCILGCRNSEHWHMYAHSVIGDTGPNQCIE